MSQISLETTETTEKPMSQPHIGNAVDPIPNAVYDDKLGKKEEEEDFYDSNSKIQERNSHPHTDRPSHIDVATFKAHKKIKAKVHAEMNAHDVNSLNS